MSGHNARYLRALHRHPARGAVVYLWRGGAGRGGSGDAECFREFFCVPDQAVRGCGGGDERGLHVSGEEYVGPGWV